MQKFPMNSNISTVSNPSCKKEEGLDGVLENEEMYSPNSPDLINIYILYFSKILVIIKETCMDL